MNYCYRDFAATNNVMSIVISKDVYIRHVNVGPYKGNKNIIIILNIKRVDIQYTYIEKS